MFGKKYWFVFFALFLLSIQVYAASDLPLSEAGPYAVGVRIVRMQDLQRDKIVVNTTVWYPAMVGADGKPTSTPDMSGAPYPLVIYSHGSGSAPSEVADTGLALALVSHGFVVAAPLHHDDGSAKSYIDRPLDVLLVINKLAAVDKGDLLGLIDTDHVGVTGASSGGDTSMLSGGARINPVATKQWLASPVDPSNPLDLRLYYPDWNWDDFSQYGGRFLKLDGDNLWPAITDERIRAVMPTSVSAPSLYSKEGLAAITGPIFMMIGTKDQYNPYQNVVETYSQIGSKDRYLLTVVGGNHEFALAPRLQRVINHFAVAYFGYYLQGKADYAQYLTADYVKSLTDYDNLVWGVYDGE